MFPNKAIRVVFVVVSKSVILLNCFSIVLCVLKQLQHCHVSKIRTAKAKTKRSFNVLIISVNLCDLSCGCYLVIIWAADLHYGLVFVLRQQLWLSSSICSFAFGLALEYSLLSACLLCFVSLARTMVILFPFKAAVIKSTQFILKFLLALFIISCTPSACLTGYLFSTSGSTNCLCLPFIDRTRSVLEVKVLVLFLMILQTLSSVFVGLMYFFLMRAIRKSSKKVNRKFSTGGTSVQLTLLIANNFICWIPSNGIFLTSLFATTVSTEILFWTVAVIVPINPVSNPVVFSAYQR